MVNKKYFSFHNLAVFLLIVITFVVYFGSLKNEFVWDDFLVIVNNNFIKSWNNFCQLFNKSYLTPPSQIRYLEVINIGSGESSYRPVVTLTYFIDYFFYKLNPWGYHLTNLLLHILNVLLLYFLIRLITQNNIIALLAGLLFAVHPVNTEAVDVITFREDLLCFLFFVSSFVLFIKSANSLKKRNLFYSLSLFFFFLALFSKEMAVSLPLIILLYFLLFRERIRIEFTTFRKYFLGYSLILAFYLYIRFVIFNIDEPLGRYIADNLYINFLNMVRVAAQYIQWLVFPINIYVALPENPARLCYSLFDVRVLSSLALIVFILILGIRAYKSSKYLSFSIFWFFITLLPVANIVPIVNYMACRYLYLPLPGFCLLFSILIFRLFNVYSFRFFKITLVILILLFYSTFTINRHPVWRNDFSLALEMLKIYPDNPSVHRGVGALLERAGFLDLAIKEHKKAVALKSDYVEAHNRLGCVYYKKGLIDKAIQEFKKAIKLDPSFGEAYANIGVAFIKKGLYKEAVKYLKQGINLDPKYVFNYNNLAIAYIELGRFEEAKKTWQKALEIEPDFETAQKNLNRLKEEHLELFKD